MNGTDDARGEAARGLPNVLVVDDHIGLAEALALALQRLPIEVTVSSGRSDHEVLAAADAVSPDVVLLDLHLAPDRTSMPLIAPLTERGARVLVLTATDEPALLAACLHAGAAAVLPKSEALGAFVDAVRAALAGETVRAREGAELRAEGRAAQAEQAALLEAFATLTPRECETLVALLDGKRAADIAAGQGISVRTVRSHVEAIRSKLGVRSQLEAVALARRARWTNR